MSQKMDVGYHALLSQVTNVHVVAANCVIDGQQERAKSVSAHVWSVDNPADRDNFRSQHAKTFSTPDRFEFQPHAGDEVCFSGDLDCCVLCHN